MIGKIFRLSFLSMLVLVFFYNPVDCYPQFYKKKTEKKRSFQEIQGEAHRYWENREQDKKPGYKQYKRWEWQTESRLNSDGYTDAGLKWKGWQEKKERFGATAAEAGSNWVSLGPVQRGQIMGLGRINCMAFDPQNNDIIWIGSPTGGLWKSENGGQTWGNLTDHLPNLGVSDIIIHPENSDIIYFATGDKGRASSLSTGVMKSLDGGLTWELTGLNHGLEDQYLINKLGVHKSKTDILLAATNHGIYKTIDAGTTWEKKLDGDFYDLEICTNCSCTWYASKSGDGVYKSTDAGDNWTRLSVGLPAPSSNIGRIALAVCDSSPDSVYAVYSQEFAGIGWEWGLYGIYRSMDGGNTWSLQANSPNMLGWDTTGMDSGGQGGYALVFEVDPEDVDEVYVGSVHLWRSADGGENWLCITGSGGGAAVHVDHHDFAFLPGNPDTMFSANDGGLYKTENSGIHWTDLSNGLVIQEIYRVGVAGSEKVIAGVQDNGSEVFNGDWRSVMGGDGMDCAFDPSNSSSFYCSSQFGNFQRQDNGVARSILANLGNCTWVAPLEIDPSAPKTLFIASDRVFRSDDRGNSRVTISGALSGRPITRLKAAPSNSDYIYATDSTRLFKTSDGGTSWQELNNDSFNYYITDIAIHPYNPKRIWVTMGGYGRWNCKFIWNGIEYEIDKEKVFTSNDGGENWTDVSGLLPNIPVNCILVDDYTFGIYIGTDLGVFYSATGSGNWKLFENGLPNVIVTDLEIRRETDTIVAATFGRGLWESPLASGTTAPRLYPPMRLTGELIENKSLFQTEYLNALHWQANPRNSGKGVTRYRVYLVNGLERTLLGESSGGIFEFLHRGTQQATTRYAVTPVDTDDYEGLGVYMTIRNPEVN